MKWWKFIFGNFLKIILFCFLNISVAFGEANQLRHSPLLNKSVSGKQTSESVNSLSHQISETSKANDPLSVYPDSEKKPMGTSNQETFKREAAFINGKAGLGYSLFDTYVASFLLEFKTPFIKEDRNFSWLVQASGGTAFAPKIFDPYLSVHTGLKYDFGNVLTSFTMGLFYSELLKYQPTYVFSLGFPLLSNKTLIELELNVGFLHKLGLGPVPIYFILSLTIPLKIF